MLQGDATEEKLDKKLKNLVKDNWDFKVKNIHLQEYLVVFPDKGSLETFTKLSEFQMSLFGLKGRIEKTERVPETSSLLQTVWIRVLGLPDLAKEPDIVKEIVALVAKPLVVDELSLIKTSLVIVQGRCRNPGSIRGSIEIFFNGVGTFIGFEVEEGGQGSLKGGRRGPPPRPGKSDDKFDKDRDNYPRDSKPNKNLSKFDRVGKIDREIESGHEESMEETMEKEGVIDGDSVPFFWDPISCISSCNWHGEYAIPQVAD